jgi:hypothetical protein
MCFRLLCTAFILCMCLFAYCQKKISAYKTFAGVVYELNDSITISPRQVSILHAFVHHYSLEVLK